MVHEIVVAGVVLVDDALSVFCDQLFDHWQYFTLLLVLVKLCDESVHVFRERNSLTASSMLLFPLALQLLQSAYHGYSKYDNY